MKKSNSRTTNPKTTIQCVEVLVSKNSVFNSGHNLQWTLSVYSLENEPVKKDLSLANSEVFHFMVYDWNRTIKKLLEDRQVPYSIVRFFTPESLFFPTQEKYALPDDENTILLALRKLEGLSEDRSSSLYTYTDAPFQEEKDAHFVLNDGDF